MDVSDCIASLRREGDLLAAAAAGAALDGPVPSCPGWQVRDLVQHIGGVHRWAAAHVAVPWTRRMTEAETDEAIRPYPGDGALLDWYRDGHAVLVHTLETADPDRACWTFLPAPSPVAFWARRQAHETGIHRVDAEGAGRAVPPTLTPFPPAVAADGIDELAMGFVGSRGGRLRVELARALHVHATDTGSDWLVRIGPEGTAVTRDAADADCVVRGPASELFLLLWNRRTPDGLDVSGDDSLLTLWRESVRIRWS